MRILLVARDLMWPAVTGGQQRSWLLYKALAMQGEVDTVILRPRPGDAAAASELEQRFRVVAWAPQNRRGARGAWRFVRVMNPRLIDRIADTLDGRATSYAPNPAVAPTVRRLLGDSRYDVVVGRYLQPLAASGAIGDKLGTPAVLDLDDHDAEVLRARAHEPGIRWWKKVALRRQAESLEEKLPTLLRQCAAVWVSNPGDIGRPGLEGAVRLPNIPMAGDAAGAILPESRSQVVSVIASFNYAPNVAGIDHFVSRVWPRIKRAAPQAEFRIHGSHISPACRARWGAAPGVRVVGFVDSRETAYADAAFSVVPVYSGGGTSIKVIESLSFARTCVVTEMVARGYEQDLRHDESLLVAPSDEAFADACVALLADPARRRRLALHGRRIVEAHYGFTNFSEIVRNTLRTVAVRPPYPHD